MDSTGQIVWRYGEGLRFAHNCQGLKNGNILIADTTNNRVIEVSRDKKIVFTTDAWSDGTGMLSDGSHLDYPNDAHELDDGTLLITDRNNDRCIIVDRSGKVLWFYSDGIQHPHNADMTPDGNIIIADSDHNRVFEVNRSKEIVWTYGTGDKSVLNWPRDADRLENGNTLITDSKNKRVLEVTPKGEVVWSYESSHFPHFYSASKLANGNVLISDQQHRQVIEVDSFGNIVWLFRNYRNINPVFDRIKNGSFKERDNNNLPKHWVLNKRVSEGRGKVIWKEGEKPYPCPGIEYDLSGALYLQQMVRVTGDRRYKMAGKIRTELSEGGFAYFQTAFLDELGGLIQDAAQAPKGEMFTGKNDWREDFFEARAPQNAKSVELRIFQSGKGKIWAKNVMFVET